MEMNKIFSFLKPKPDRKAVEHKAGTGFMPALSDRILEFEKMGYTENLVAKNNHFTCRDGLLKLYPPEIYIDYMIRFENSSDPDDQSILYAISSEKKGVKGIFIESYGINHDQISEVLLERIKYCRTHRRDLVRVPDSIL